MKDRGAGRGEDGAEMRKTDPGAARDPGAKLIDQAMAEPLLTRDQEVALSRRWQARQDETALHALVASHTRLVVSMARKFRGYGLPVGDLIQEGNMGLLQAIRRFDPERGFRLATYAMWWIKAAMTDYVLRNWSIVRLGTTAADKSLFFNLRKSRSWSEAIGTDGLSPQDRDRLADSLGVDVSIVERMESRLAGHDSSMNAPVAGIEGDQIQDLLADDNPSPEEAAMQSLDRAVRSRWLAAALRKLPKREAMIIRERHLREEGRTLEDLGRQLGVSKERVRQLERRALFTLQGLAGAAEEVGGTA